MSGHLIAPALPLPNALSRFFHDSPAAVLHKSSGFEITLHTSFPSSVQDRGKRFPLFHHNCHRISTVQSHLKRGLIACLSGLSWTAIRHWSDGNQAPISALSVPDTKKRTIKRQSVEELSLQVMTVSRDVPIIFQQVKVKFSSSFNKWCSSVFQQVRFTSSFNKWGSHHLSTSEVSPSFNIYLK